MAHVLIARKGPAPPSLPQRISPPRGASKITRIPNGAAAAARKVRFRMKSLIYSQMMQRNLFGIYITIWQFLLTTPSPSISLGRGKTQ